MKYLFIMIVLLSCSKKNYSERTISSQLINPTLNRIQIINSNFIEEINLSIESFKKETGKKPDYATFYVSYEASLRLNKFQCDNADSAKEIKEEINSAKGIVIINDVPTLVFYTDENSKFFNLSNEKLNVNIKCSLSNSSYERNYEISNGKLIIYYELFLRNTGVEKAK